MWTVINNIDRSDNVMIDSATVDLAMGDTLSTASLRVKDPGSQIPLAIGQTVMIWDETALPDSSSQTVPALNLIIDPSFAFGGANYVTSGTNAGIITFPSFSALWTFNNQTGSTIAADGRITQNTMPAGYVTPGTQYIFSAYVRSTSATNVAFYMEINWQDANRNALSTTSTVYNSSFTNFATPPTSQKRCSVFGTAPANSAFAQVQIGCYPTVSGTNSGTVTVTTLQLEPIWFVGKALANGAVVTYPTQDCNFYQVTTTLMPDDTFARTCRLFLGTITNLQATYQGTTRDWAVDCTSSGGLLEYGALIEKAYTSQTDAFIIGDIISTYFSGVLSIGQANSSQPSTTVFTGPTIDSISWTDVTFREVLNNLTDVSGFSYFLDAYNYLNYQPIPFDYANLQVSDQNVDYATVFPPGDYQLTQDGTQMRNSVKVTGGKFVATDQDVFSGDGSTKTFTLDHAPVNIINITIGGSTYAPTSTNKIGVTGQQKNGTGGVVALMSPQSKHVTFNTAPASGSSNVVITYSFDSPVAILTEANASVGQYGRRMSKVNDSSLTSNLAGQLRGESELAAWSQPVTDVQFTLTSQYNNGSPVPTLVYPGTTIYFSSSLDGITKQPFAVQTVEITSPGGGVNIYKYNCCKVYRPKMLDLHRNTIKTIARSTTDPSSAVAQLTYETVEENLYYSDTVTHTP